MAFYCYRTVADQDVFLLVRVYIILRAYHRQISVNFFVFVALHKMPILTEPELILSYKLLFYGQVKRFEFKVIVSTSSRTQFIGR